MLEDTVSTDDLKRYEDTYREELSRTGGKASATAQFVYGSGLVRSKYPADVRKGILLLEDLFKVR